MSFVPSNIIENLSSLTRDQADREDYGIVKLDDSGNVVLYNKYESELGNVPVSEAEGKNFFTNVAPCTNNKLFKGKFEKGVADQNINEQFNYTFTYKLRPTNVAVHIYRNPTDSCNWVFIKKR